MGSKFTKYDLEHVTDYIEFESFCNDLVSREGYKDIEPLGGFKDKGRDAIHVSKITGETTIFTYSVREDWKAKLYEDLEKIKKYKHTCNKVMFISTSSPTATGKDKLKRDVKSNYSWELEIFDLERIATLIDNHYKDLKQLHPNIFIISSKLEDSDLIIGELNKHLYAEFLLGAYQEWLEKYTPLLADYREVETYVSLREIEQSSNEIPVVQIPQIAQISVILGESGAGKTTALWRIIVEISQALKESKTQKIPILINLRGWATNHRCRSLIQDQFEIISASQETVEQELEKGNCIILIDGLNELQPNEWYRIDAYQDIQRFISKYKKNMFVFCCRASDYEERMLDYEQKKSNFEEPKIFEIRRMDQGQMVNYVERYFQDSPNETKEFLAKLDINNSKLWEDNTTILHLARIPLYLQLLISEFKRNKDLPNNKAKLLKSLIDTIMRREKVRYAAVVDRYAKERLLSSSAYKAMRQGYLLRIPEDTAQEIIRTQIQKLKDGGLIQSELTFGAVWQEILSNNFLKPREAFSVEWLHQLIFDFFLGNEIIRIWLDNKEEIEELSDNLRGNVWGQSCAIGLGLLDQINNVNFLEYLIVTNSELAQQAFEGQTEEVQYQISESILNGIFNETEIDKDHLLQVVKSLPFIAILEVLITSFSSGDENIRTLITEAVSWMIIENYPKIAGSGGGFALKGSNYHYQYLRKAIKRAFELLTAWSKNKDELVRFYAMKGLWEYDRGLAVKILKDLFLNGKPATVNLVEKMMSDWGIHPYE
jgi:hypothetical protein